jgi:hypothetical protein
LSFLRDLIVHYSDSVNQDRWYAVSSRSALGFFKRGLAGTQTSPFSLHDLIVPNDPSIRTRSLTISRCLKRQKIEYWLDLVQQRSM